MKAKLWDLVLLLGVLCFLAGGAALAWGYLGAPEKYALPALGLILVGAGASGKKRRG